MNRLEALERVASAVRHYIHGNGHFEAVRGALDALDTIPPEPAEDVVEVELWAHADGDVAVLVRGSAISQDWATNRYRTRLGTTLLVLAKEVRDGA